MLPWPAGDAFWNLVSITPVRDTAGKVMSFIGVHSDITELVRRREAEKELQEAKVSAHADSPFCPAYGVCCSHVCIDMPGFRVPASLWQVFCVAACVGDCSAAMSAAPCHSSHSTSLAETLQPLCRWLLRQQQKPRACFWPT